MPRDLFADIAAMQRGARLSAEEPEESDRDRRGRLRRWTPPIDTTRPRPAYDGNPDSRPARGEE